jgi:opacity protein-like surface antigen
MTTRTHAIRHTCAAAALAAAATAGQVALAAGPVPVATPEPVVIGPSGNWYAGVEAGASSGADYRTTATVTDDSYCSTNIYDYPGAVSADCGSSGSGTPSADGTAVGLFIGYNTMRGDMLLGGEFRAMSFGDGDTIDLLPTIPGLLTAKVGFGELYELRARFGTQMGERAMLYGALGMARASLEVEACALSICASNSISDTAPSAGFGLEYDLSATTFVGADYTMRQFDFGGQDVDLNTLTLRVGYRF